MSDKLESSEAILLAVIIKCGMLVSGSPAQAALARPVNPMLSKASTSDLPVQLRLELRQGVMRFEVSDDQVALQVDTGTLTVSAAGINDFGVGYDPDSQTSIVAAYQGLLDIQPANSELQPLSLQTGEMVQVGKDSLGAVEPIPQGTQETIPQSTPLGGSTIAGVAVIACGCLLGLAVLVVVVILLVRRRKPQAVNSGGMTPPANYPAPYGPPPFNNAMGQVPQTPQVIQPAWAVVAAPSARLLVVRGVASLPIVNLAPAGLVIGRDASCGLVLTDEMASRLHAHVEFSNGMWQIRDLGSSNGTCVNGVRVQQKALSPGDRVLIGQTELVFQLI